MFEYSHTILTQTPDSLLLAVLTCTGTFAGHLGNAGVSPCCVTGDGRAGIVRVARKGGIGIGIANSENWGLRFQRFLMAVVVALLDVQTSA